MCSLYFWRYGYPWGAGRDSGCEETCSRTCLATACSNLHSITIRLASRGHWTVLKTGKTTKMSSTGYTSYGCTYIPRHCFAARVAPPLSELTRLVRRVRGTCIQSSCRCPPFLHFFSFFFFFVQVRYTVLLAWIIMYMQSSTSLVMITSLRS